jgi:hypothetical protein
MHEVADRRKDDMSDLDDSDEEFQVSLLSPTLQMKGQ